jgi:prevent-host-death family protein
MTKIGTYQAKTKLPELLHRVESGESFTITRNGKPVAKLVPFESSSPKKGAEDIVRALREIRRKAKPGGPLRELINEGRRF